MKRSGEDCKDEECPKHCAWTYQNEEDAHCGRRYKRVGDFEGSGATIKYGVTCGIPEHYLGVQIDTKNNDNVRCAEFSYKSEHGSGSDGDAGVLGPAGPFGGGSSGDRIKDQRNG